MMVEAMRYEGLLRATGAGAFGNVEYDGRNNALLRTGAMKTADLSGTLRIYFNNHREQIMSGRRFDPMPSGIILLRPGVFYRVYATLEIVEPLPNGVSAFVVLNEDAADIMMVTTGPFREGFSGPVCFTIQPFRKIDVEKMTSFGSLMFFEDAVVPAELSEVVMLAMVKAEVKKALKKGNSDRTKKSSASVKKKAAPKGKAEEMGEGSVPDEHPDNPES